MVLPPGSHHGALDFDDHVRPGVVIRRKFIELSLTDKNRIADGKRARSRSALSVRINLGLGHSPFVEATNVVHVRIGRRMARQKSLEPTSRVKKAGWRNARRRMRSSTIRHEERTNSPLPISVLDVRRPNDFPQTLHERLRLAIRFRPERGDLLCVEAKVS